MPAQYLAETKKFARFNVIAAAVLIVVKHPYFARALGAQTKKLRLPQRERGRTNMKAFIFAAGLAVALASTMQVAAAAERQNQNRSERVVVRQPSRAVSDAYAAWPAPQVAPSGYGYGPVYSGGYSAPAGR
jgi:uncharacterized membrane protein